MQEYSLDLVLIYKKAGLVILRIMSDTTLGDEQLQLMHPIEKQTIDNLKLTENDLAVFCAEDGAEDCTHLVTIPYFKPVATILKKLTNNTRELTMFREHIDHCIVRSIPDDYVLLVYGIRGNYWGRVFDEKRLGIAKQLPVAFYETMSNIPEDSLGQDRLVVFFTNSNTPSPTTSMVCIKDMLAPKVVSATLTQTEHTMLFSRIGRLRRNLLTKSAAEHLAEKDIIIDVPRFS